MQEDKPDKIVSISVLLKHGIHGCVIRGAFQCARLFVDDTRCASFRQGLAGQDQIDAQSAVAAKAGGTVIPPAEIFFCLFE
jgi:hypothetical protein